MHKVAMYGRQMARNTSTWLVVSLNHVSPRVYNSFVLGFSSILDCCICMHYAGIGVASTGHCHPKVVKAIQDQTQEFIIAQQNIFTSSPAMVDLSAY